MVSDYILKRETAQPAPECVKQFVSCIVLLALHHQRSDVGTLLCGFIIIPTIQKARSQPNTQPHPCLARVTRTDPRLPVRGFVFILKGVAYSRQSTVHGF